MKMTYIKSIIVLLTLTVTLSQTNAQNVMSLEECRERAVEFNKSLKIAKLQQEEAEANKKTARTAYLPSVNAQGTATLVPGVDDISLPGKFLQTANSEDEAKAGIFTGESNVWNPGLELELGNLTILQGQIGIELPIYAGGKIRYTNKMADLAVNISNEAYKRTYTDIIQHTDQAYWNVVAMEENVKLANDYLSMLSELEEQMTDMYELGLAPASEKLKVAVQKNEAELGLLRARNGLRLTKMALNQIMGLDLNEEVEVSNNLNSQIILPNFANGVSDALQNRPELKMLKDRLGLTEYDKKMVQSDYLPQVGVGVNQTYSKITTLFDDGQWNTMAAAQVSIPVFHWRESKHRKKAAEMEVQQAQMDLSNSQDLITLEVNQVQIQVQEAMESVEIAKKGISQAKESLEETKISFEVGLNTTTDLLNAQAEWQRAQNNLIASLTRYEVLKTNWLRVTGNLE